MIVFQILLVFLRQTFRIGTTAIICCCYLLFWKFFYAYEKKVANN